MYVRTQLTVRDHNSSIKRKQSTTNNGNLTYNMIYSKVTSSWVARKVMKKKEKAFSMAF